MASEGVLLAGTLKTAVVIMSEPVLKLSSIAFLPAQPTNRIVVWDSVDCSSQ